MPLNIETQLTPERIIVAPPDSDVPAEDPGIFDALGAAWRRENTVGSLLANLDTFGKFYEDQEGYDQFEGNEGTIFERYPNALVGIGSPEEKEDARQRLLREEQDLQTIHESGAFGWLGAIAMGFFDPIILVPFGGAARAARLGKTAGALAKLPAPLRGGVHTARAATAGAAVTEAILQSEQDTRTWGESVLNVGGAAFLSGVLGTSVSYMDRALTHAAVADVESQLGRVAGGSGDPNAIRITPEEIRADSAGTAENLKIKLKDSFGAARVVAGMRLSPFVSLMVKSRSNTLKQALLDMADAPCLVEGWTPNTPVTQAVEGWHVVKNLAMEKKRALFAEYKKGGGRLNEREFNIEVANAQFRNDRHSIPQVAEAAKIYREEVLNPMLDRMMETGKMPADYTDFEVTGSQSYLTRVYNKNNIVAYREKFAPRLKNAFRETLSDDEIDAITKKYQGLSHEEAIEMELEQAVDDTIDNIVGHSDGRLMLAPLKPGKASALKPRKLTILDEVLRHPIPDGEGGWIHFLEMDADVLLNHYVRTVAPDVELHARFGSVNMERQIHDIAQEYKELIAAETNPKKRVKIEKQMRKEIQLMQDLKDRVRGVYGLPGAEYGTMTTIARVARAFNVFAQGGGFMLSSLPDVGMVVMRNGLWRTFRTGVVPLVTHFNSVRLSAKELKLMGVGLEAVESKASAIADYGDEFARNWIERGAQKLTRGFMMMNLLTPWNVMMKRFTGVVSQTRMIEAILDLERGAISKMDAEDLIQTGIGNEMAKKIAIQLRKAGGMQSEGPLKWAKTMDWDDMDARRAFSAAMRNLVDQTIVTPGAVDRPMFFSKEWGKTMFQYKSFAFSATQRVMLTGMQKRDAAALNGMAIMLAMGLGVEFTKSRLAGREGPQEPQEMIKAALDRSGTVGILGDFVNILERTGALPFFRGPLSSRYAARNTTSAILGPSVGLGESAIQLMVAGGKGEWTASDTRTARRLLPYQNLFYFRNLFDYAEEGVNDALGIPKRRSR